MSAKFEKSESIEVIRGNVGTERKGSNADWKSGFETRQTKYGGVLAVKTRKTGYIYDPMREQQQKYACGEQVYRSLIEAEKRALRSYTGDFNRSHDKDWSMPAVFIKGWLNDDLETFLRDYLGIRWKNSKIETYGDELKLRAYVGFEGEEDLFRKNLITPSGRR